MSVVNALNIVQVLLHQIQRDETIGSTGGVHQPVVEDELPVVYFPTWRRLCSSKTLIARMR